MRAALPLLLFFTAVGGCQCHLDPTDLNNIPDAGHDPHDAGPPPPVFPLKAGDSVIVEVGGRTATCTGSSTPGDCQIAVQAEYDITAVALDHDTNRFVVTANVTYTGEQNNLIDDASISSLVLENVAPFATATFNNPSQAADAAFTTDAAPTDAITPNGFPFFEFNQTAPEIFETAGNTFCARYVAIDPDANCHIQAAAAQMEVFYKDTLSGGAAKLHEVHVEYHVNGFIGGWDERTTPFIDGTTTRDESAFAGTDTPDVAAIFITPKLKRGGVSYICDTFTQVCQTTSSPRQCLTTNPDDPPGDCP